jgi:hypothetical protein
LDFIARRSDEWGLQHNHISAHYVTVVKGLVKLGERAEHNTYLEEYETASSSKRSDHARAGSRSEYKSDLDPDLVGQKS